MTFNEEKLAKMKTASNLFNERYGKSGTQLRNEFENKALAWYYGEVLREKRKELNITQQQLAETIGKKREYISLLEKGETDIQLSTFFTISQALGLRFTLV
jgi:DNA-binding XRE family transcriptional regulator